MHHFMPTALNEALDHIAAKEIKIVAGGTDYFPSQNQGPIKTDLLDISRIPELSGISCDGDTWRIGATTSWSDIFRTKLPPCFDGLQAAAREVGSLQIQNAGTVAGNVCNASPAADGVPPLLTLDAQAELQSVRGKRVIPLNEFITGVRDVALASDEMVTGFLLPNVPHTAVGAFEKLGSRRYLVISITMTAAVIGFDPQGRINHARVAIGACSPVAQRLLQLEADLIGKTLGEITLNDSHFSTLSPIADVRGSAEFRLEAVAEQCLRTITKAAQAHE
ncbi:xanthine dehydrogenase family protein subunit M [Phaeobacter sp. NW0010-22]